MLPENNPHSDSDYYAIDIANRPETINFLIAYKNLINENNIESLSICGPLSNLTIFLAEFPPCDPLTFKLRQLCQSECPKFNDYISRCFGEITKQNTIMIGGFAELFDLYNCSDPSTYIRNVSVNLFDLPDSCYSVSLSNMGKYVIIRIQCS